MDIFRETYIASEKNLPTVEVGDSWIRGTGNRYDSIAFSKGVVPKLDDGNFLYPIESWYSRIKLLEIKKIWTPKPNSGVHAWLHDNDYSKDGRFEVAYEYLFSQEALFYELADLLDEPRDTRIKLIFDYKNCMQFYEG